MSLSLFQPNVQVVMDNFSARSVPLPSAMPIFISWNHSIWLQSLLGVGSVEFSLWSKLYHGEKDLSADVAYWWRVGKWGQSEAFLQRLLWKLAFMWISDALLPWLGRPHLAEWSHPSRPGRQTFVPENQSGPSRALLTPLSPASEGVHSYKPDRPHRTPGRPS